MTSTSFYKDFVPCHLTIRFSSVCKPVECSEPYDNVLQQEQKRNPKVESYGNYMSFLPADIQNDIVFFEKGGKAFCSHSTSKETRIRSIDSETEKLVYRDVYLTHASGAIAEEPVIPGVRTVCAVLFYMDHNGAVYVANTVHREDATYGFPGGHEAPPGGRIEDGMTPLGTALTEAFEEMGSQHLVCDGDIYEGYAVHGVAAYVFIRHQKKPEIMENRPPRISTTHFEPFAINVLIDHEAFTSIVHETMATTSAMADWDKVIKEKTKDLYKKVLVPRALGRFDFDEYGYELCHFDQEFFVKNIPGRFGSWRKGCPVYLGLRDILKRYHISI